MSPQNPSRARVAARGVFALTAGGALMLSACGAGGDGAALPTGPLPPPGGGPRGAAGSGSAGTMGPEMAPGGGVVGSEGVGPNASPPAEDLQPMGLGVRCQQSEPGAPTLRRLNRRELEATIRDVFPMVDGSWRSSLSPDTVSELGFDNDSSQLVVSGQAARELAATAESVGQLVAEGIDAVLPCAATAPGTDCAAEYLAGVGRRLFRRPLTGEESTAMLGFFETAQELTGDFPTAVSWLTRALIESPNFVYRRELGAEEGGVVRLDQFEIATELAFTFTGRGPSEELLGRAERGELSSPQVLEQTARDLLMNEGEGVIQNFFDAYVGHSRVTSLAKAEVPEFADLRAQMLQETHDFIDEVVINRGGGVRELLTADFTTPSAALAQFYGLSAPSADGEVVPRGAERGLGLLAQGAVLSTLAQPDGSSPTKRGLWVFERLLCDTVPPVPANIPELQPPQPGARTTRQRYEEDHAVGGCANCHQRWDPIGFAFEHFDEAGRYREMEGNQAEGFLPIDTESRLPYRGQTVFEFDGQEELVTQLADLPIVHQCLSGHLAAYAFGEAVECGAESKRQQFVDGEIGFVDYLASLAAEPHFTTRVTGE